MTAIDAVVFDWGGVLAGGSDAEVLAAVEARLGVAPGTLPRLFGLDPYETDPENVWHRRELGRATALEWARWYAERIVAAGGRPLLEPEAMVAAEATRFTIAPNAVVMDAVHRLHAEGYRLAICTNNVTEMSDVWRTGLPLELFDVVVDSCQLGHRKPDAAIFDHVTGTLGVAPAATVLLDDIAANVAGARRSGWHAIQVGADHAAGIAELDALLAAHPRE